MTIADHIANIVLWYYRQVVSDFGLEETWTFSVWQVKNKMDFYISPYLTRLYRLFYKISISAIMNKKKKIKYHEIVHYPSIWPYIKIDV